jgi:hypothetical protein
VSSLYLFLLFSYEAPYIPDSFMLARVDDHHDDDV